MKFVHTWIIPLAAGVAAWLGIIGAIRGNDKLFIVGGGLFLAIGFPNLVKYGRQYWRGEGQLARRLDPPNWWPYSRALWHGELRSMTVVSLGAVPAFASVLVGIGISEFEWPAAPSELWWLPLFGLVMAAIWITVVGLGILVVLYNKPKVVVPPHLRGQPGWLEVPSHLRNDSATVDGGATDLAVRVTDDSTE